MIMPDKAKPASEFLHITDPHNCPVEFVSLLAASGQNNGVVNLTFATARFMPTASGTIDPDFIVSSRLRMDIACAAQLRGELDRIIGQAQQQLSQALGTALATSAVTGASGKSN